LPAILTGDDEIRGVLNKTKVIAVVGASPRPERTSHGVMARLQRRGYRTIPVNPTAAGQTILGERVYASLKDVPVHVDMVDVFRRAEDTPPVAGDAVAIGAGMLWLQLGISSDEAARIATEGGLDVVMDRCTAIEIDRLGTRPPS